MTVLEDKLRCKLNLSCCICGAVDGTEGWPAVDVMVGLTQVYVVEHIERLGSKLELPPFPHREQAKERRIQVPKGWASEGIASCVAEGVKRGRGIRGGIEPFRCG